MVIKKSYEPREDGIFECNNCDKVFSSLKAIHGHQRVHKTTATVPSNVTTEVKDDQRRGLNDNQRRGLNDNQRRGLNDDQRRGTLKRIVAAMAEGASLDFEEIEKVKLGLDELEAMDGFQMLLYEFNSHVCVCSSSPASDSKDPPILADQEDQKTEEDNVNVDQQTVLVVPKQEEERLGTPTIVGNNNINGESSGSGSREFKCNRCFKSYTTSQALGGHMAGHNGMDRKAAAMAEGGKSDSELVNREHKCEKCGSTFSTGQALGGHMRKHAGEKNNIVFNAADHQTKTTQVDSQEDTSSINAMEITMVVDDDGAATGTVVKKETDEDVIMEDIHERNDDDCKRSGLTLDLNMEPIDLDDD